MEVGRIVHRARRATSLPLPKVPHETPGALRDHGGNVSARRRGRFKTLILRDVDHPGTAR